MKRILMLLLTAGSLYNSVQAQTNEDARRVILGDRRTGSDNRTGSDPREVILGDGERRNDSRRSDGSVSSRRAEIDAVNRDYDQRIQRVRNNPLLSANEKQRRIRSLEEERRQRIREINNYYGRNRDDRQWEDDDDNRNRRHQHKKYKGQRGNKYGWEKGRGNPHRNRDRDWDDD